MRIEGQVVWKRFSNAKYLKIKRKLLAHYPEWMSKYPWKYIKFAKVSGGERIEKYENLNIKEQFCWFNRHPFVVVLAVAAVLVYKCNYNLKNTRMRVWVRVWDSPFEYTTLKLAFDDWHYLFFHSVNITFRFVLLFSLHFVHTDINTFIIHISFYVTDKQTNKL